MVLRTISDSELLSKLKTLVQTEREILTEILHHLLEVETRKLHLIEGYGSMFQYAIEALGYSEAQAYRRISAMRLLRELPQIADSIQNGSLNLTHLTQAREYFKSEAKKEEALSKDEKLTILSSLEHKTTRETEKIFAGLDPDKIPTDQERPLRENLTEIRFVANDALLEKLKRFKELDSHVQKDPNYAELFERLVDLALKKKASPSAPKKTSVKTKTAKTKSADRSDPIAHSPPAVRDEVGKQNSRSRYIPIFIQRVVQNQDDHSCRFVSPITGKRCGSRYRLQFEHKKPFAKGGAHSVKNLKILCQSHNLLMAEKQFGKEKMSQYQASLKKIQPTLKELRSHT